MAIEQPIGKAWGVGEQHLPDATERLPARAGNKAPFRRPRTGNRGVVVAAPLHGFGAVSRSFPMGPFNSTRLAPERRTPRRCDHAPDVAPNSFGLGIFDVFTKVRPEKPKPGSCMNL
jgi:hypothetical protein